MAYRAAASRLGAIRVRGSDRGGVIRHAWNMVFGALRWLRRYFLLGAVVVIPVWLLLRLFSGAL